MASSVGGHSSNVSEEKFATFLTLPKTNNDVFAECATRKRQPSFENSKSPVEDQSAQSLRPMSCTLVSFCQMECWVTYCDPSRSLKPEMVVSREYFFGNIGCGLRQVIGGSNSIQVFASKSSLTTIPSLTSSQPSRFSRSCQIGSSSPHPGRSPNDVTLSHSG